MKIYAMYRMYYGEDFIEASIRSIYDQVDKIFVFVPQAAYGNVYLGRVDKSREVVLKLKETMDKIEIIHNLEYSYTPKNQFTDLYNTYVRGMFDSPDIVMCIESDMVWHESSLTAYIKEFVENDYECVNSAVIEFWHNKAWMIPSRNRKNCILHWLDKDEPMAKTGLSGEQVNMHRSEFAVYNFGYCMKPANMKRKFDLSIKYAGLIQDSIPYIQWYEEVWYRWHPELNNENLEISAHYRHYITHAYKSDYPIPHALKDHQWNPDIFIQAQD